MSDEEREAERVKRRARIEVLHKFRSQRPGVERRVKEASELAARLAIQAEVCRLDGHHTAAWCLERDAAFQLTYAESEKRGLRWDR